MKPVWIRSWLALGALGVGVFAVVFAVAWREIRDAFFDVRNVIFNLFGD